MLKVLLTTQNHTSVDNANEWMNEMVSLTTHRDIQIFFTSIFRYFVTNFNSTTNKCNRSCIRLAFLWLLRTMPIIFFISPYTCTFIKVKNISRHAKHSCSSFIVANDMLIKIQGAINKFCNLIPYEKGKYFLIADWTNTVLHYVMYTDKMIASFVVMTSSWRNCLLFAWEIESLKFEYRVVIKFLLKERCMQQKSINVWSPCMVTLHLITVQ